MVLNSCKKAFWQIFELFKKWVTEQFSGIDIRKLSIEPLVSSGEDSASFDEKDLEEG